MFDLASPGLLELTKKMWGKNVSAGNAPFKFGPAEGTKFFEPYGWIEREYHLSMDDAKRLNRQMRMMWLWRLLGQFASKQRKDEMKRFSGVVLAERL